ncbi:MAG TPA: hypothetical protein PKE26_10560 [Kiritimatiellia bacterium]|nr:hypothetical protein [Kiritimatiellia bacterium]HMO99539.1 hypothetical protein [Kiritimatiellia bacterium]
MKKRPMFVLASLAAGSLALFVTGCDWSTGGTGSSFNTSQGAGISVNFSGFYRGELSGGRAVSPVAGNITTFTISQSGNRLTVIDNNGSRYTGSVGSPGLVASPSGGAFPPGAELVQGQVNWSGKNNATGRDIEFAGVIHVVSVTDVQGNTSNNTTTDAFENRNVETSIVRNEDTTEKTETITVGTPGSAFYSVEVIKTVTDNKTGQEISRTVTRSGNNTRTAFTEFRISDANSQYRLQGTWIEKGGGNGSVKARSAGAIGTITTQETTTTPAAPATGT